MDNDQLNKTIVQYFYESFLVNAVREYTVTMTSYASLWYICNTCNSNNYLSLICMKSNHGSK